MVKFGVKIMIGQGGLTYDTIRNAWLDCERLGFDSIWLYDHLFPYTKPKEDCLEGWVTMSSLCCQCNRIRFGILVTANTFRHPALLAKMASTLDVISGGRLEFGIGAGALEAEHRAYGIPFPDAATRIAQLDESLEIIKRMWTEEKTSFSGKYFTVNNAINYPKPVQKPHPPIVIGGLGRKLLRVAAKHADVYNADIFTSPNEFQKRISILTEICRGVGRNPKEIEKTIFSMVSVADTTEAAKNKVEMCIKEAGLSEVVSKRDPKFESVIYGTPKKCVEKIEQYIQVGVEGFILVFPLFPQIYEIRPLKLFIKEVMPQFQN